MARWGKVIPMLHYNRVIESSHIESLNGAFSMMELSILRMLSTQVHFTLDLSTWELGYLSWASHAYLELWRDPMWNNDHNKLFVNLITTSWSRSCLGMSRVQMLILWVPSQRVSKGFWFVINLELFSIDHSSTSHFQHGHFILTGNFNELQDRFKSSQLVKVGLTSGQRPKQL